ncbi:MAG: bacteriohemerythrin [Desulfovibrionaceae bacterium]|nr:bacteriohemerythrin [Desulfovibrionaceae bacterium]
MPEWHERYRIGVESIDAAHQEIFSIINRLRKTLRMSGNVQWTAAETVKYLRSYTIKHFMDEEAYMQSIGFKDYEGHKVIHDGMRDTILPKLCSYLEASKYSEESVEQFCILCEKWLNKHILGHDREIGRYVLSEEEEEE